MLFETILVVSMFIHIDCAPTVNNNKTNVQNETETKEQACLREFFTKYCSENEESMLNKLEDCEKIQPTELKKVEDACIDKVRKAHQKSGKLSYKELRDIECDNELGEEFDKCENEEIAKIQNDLIKKYPKINDIAKKIMTCGYDLYSIKHDF